MALRHKQRFEVKVSQAMMSIWHWLRVTLIFITFVSTIDRCPFTSSPYKSVFGRRVSTMRCTWPVYLSRTFDRVASTLMPLAFFSTLVFGTLSYQWTERMERRKRAWIASRDLTCRLYSVQDSAPHTREHTHYHGIIDADLCLQFDDVNFPEML